jgi:crotonobetainyl-CoA:carnitine CoA-transferase CaiB-like acyl-CoA transferase
MQILGVGDDDRFATFDGRTKNRDELERLMTEWCAARPQDEVLKVFEEAEAAIGPILDMADIARDPHYLARQAIVDVGDTPMQNLIAKLSKTPGVLRHEGRPKDADGDEIRSKGWNR